jgi:inhibitor of KinA sporulation pathway (predicted exonuclease)
MPIPLLKEEVLLYRRKAMLHIPSQFVVFDLEWTAWEGSQARRWTGPGEQREVYDIGAVMVEGEAFTMTGQFRQLVTLELTPALPAYSTNLTGITQADIDTEGISFSAAIEKFAAFAGDRHCYCWGTDGEVIAENCQLKKVPNPFSKDSFRNMRDVFKAAGIPADDYHSSTIVEYFGQHNQHTAHQGLDDALNIVEALRLLREKNTP